MAVSILSDYDIQKESTLHLGMIPHLTLYIDTLFSVGYPQYILTKAAELDDHETIENEFYPLYDKILNYWFPATEGYDVSPQWTIPNSGRSVDSTIAFVIEYQQRPLLLLEIVPPSDFHLESARECAIIQIIQRLDEIGPTNQHVQRLYAISAIGKRWRAAYVTKGKGSKDGQPVRGVTDVNSLKSAAEQCWNPDITSDASWAALQGIVDTIKSYVV